MTNITWIAANFPKEILRELFLYVCDNLYEGAKLNLGSPVVFDVKYETVNQLLVEYFSEIGVSEGDTIIVPGVEIEVS